MRDTLRHHDMEVKTARTLSIFEQGLNAEGAEKPALVIVNIATPGVDWEAAIRQARSGCQFQIQQRYARSGKAHDEGTGHC